MTSGASFRKATLSLGLLMLACFAGCLEVGVGDPASAPMDTRIIGVWTTGESEAFLIKRWDDHTYAVSEVKAGTDETGRRKYTVGRVYRGWLTKIGSELFLTLDSTPSEFGKTDKPFVIANLQIKQDDIVVRGVDPDFVRAAKQPPRTLAEMETLLKNNLDHPKLYLGEPATYANATERFLRETGN